MPKSPRKKRKPAPPQDLPPSEGLRSGRELIVMASPDMGLRARGQSVASVTGTDLSPLSDLLASEGVTLRPLFAESEEQLQERAASLAAETGAEVPDLSVFYQVEAPEERLEDLAAQLRQMDGIEAAYVKPPAQPATAEPDSVAPHSEVSRLNDMAPQMDEPPGVTPDFTARQGYLDPAVMGIDARYAWTLPGGSGAGVNIIDIEWGWRFTHEDLLQNQGGVVSGTNSPNDNHGTAVIGEFGGDRNTFGITGISPDAFVRAVSLVTHSTAQAIRIAADLLQPGDIILLEVHRAGPQAANGNGQFGFIAIEWWPDDFAAIRYAVSKGVIVVEAAGNGGQNLDDPIYNTPQTGFPSTWTNPFNPANPSSSAVVAGAGMPPAGTHGRNFQPGWGDVYADRGRCFFSNYGARVDTQGWGWEVTSTGYGDLQGGSDPNMWYTDQFSGTSSASPIVVGALACVQGVLRAHGRALLTPDRAIALLRDTGSPQQDGPAFTFIPNMAGTGYPQNHPARPRTQRIGNRPDLRQLINVAMMVPWNYNDLTTASGAPVAAGDPAGYTWDIDHTQHVVYRGIDSHIHELWFNGQWNHNDLTTASGAPVAASDPDGYTWDVDSTQHVVYKGIDSHIHELWFNGQWNHNDLTLAAGAPLALGRPAGYTWDVDHTQHVVYRGLDSHIHELWFNGQWNHNDLTMAATAPLAVSDPAGYTWDVDQTQHVVYQGMGSHIYELWFNGQWNCNDLTLAAGAPLAVGDPAGYTWDVDRTQHVVYRGVDNHIHELWFNGQWNHNDLTLAGGAPVAVGDPAGYTWDVDRTQHVVFRGTGSHIHELWFNGQWNHNDLTLAAVAPVAVGDPDGYTWDVDSTQHVVYRGTDSHIHELWFH